ncbi:MAG: VPLPA-CTERM sorting domain-containing protein [Chromatiales bacterium]|nr:VPLPA-CTERM sorting domain-containing protein [Chromatiales bacterium]
MSTRGPVLLLALALALPGTVTAASLQTDIYVRSADSITALNPGGIYPGLVVAGNPLYGSDLSLAEELRIEAQVDNMQAKASIDGGQVRLLASGFWANSLSDGIQGGEPSYAAASLVSLRDSFVLLSPGAVALSFAIDVDGSLQASSGNASWYMSAFLAQGLLGSNPNNPSDYSTIVALTSEAAPNTFYPPEGRIDYFEGISGELSGRQYFSTPFFGTENGVPVFLPGIPIQVFWNFRVDVSNSGTPPGSPGSGSANFYNTATWLGITVSNTQGEPIEGVEIIAASGYDWLAGTPVTPVPLPAGGWLLLTGLGALVARRLHPGRRPRPGDPQ